MILENIFLSNKNDFFHDEILENIFKNNNNNNA